MILSRTLAKQRIAAGVRPNWFAAWGPVLGDAGAMVLLFLLLYRPFQSAMTALEVPTFMVAMTLVLVVFIPSQAVLIVSALWAAKSRWLDTDDAR